MNLYQRKYLKRIVKLTLKTENWLDSQFDKFKQYGRFGSILQGQ